MTARAQKRQEPEKQAGLPVAVLGGSGYVARELVRILLGHPVFRLCALLSRSAAGKPLGEVHPELAGWRDLTLCPVEPSALPEKPAFLFSALPHGVSMTHIARFWEAFPDAKVVDLSADFRLPPDLYGKTYGHAHEAPALCERFAWGIAEWLPEWKHPPAAYAAPGCFTTAVSLALAPLSARRWMDGDVAAFGVTGSTGSGASPSQTTHHPERAESFRAYGLSGHRHEPEMVRNTDAVAGHSPRARASQRWRLRFTPHSAPMTRGIFAHVHAVLPEGVGPKDVDEAMEESYTGKPFVRLLGAHSPEVRSVTGTNFAEIGWAVSGGEGGGLCVARVLCAIDNLVKGAAGQAIQVANRMAGLDERVGLIPGFEYDL